MANDNPPGLCPGVCITFTVIVPQVIISPSSKNLSAVGELVTDNPNVFAFADIT